MTERRSVELLIKIFSPLFLDSSEELNYFERRKEEAVNT